MMEIEKLDGKKLSSYRVCFTDSRTGKTEYAGFDISLYADEVEEREERYSRGEFITCSLCRKG